MAVWGVMLVFGHCGCAVMVDVCQEGENFCSIFGCNPRMLRESNLSELACGLVDVGCLGYLVSHPCE